MLRVGYTLQRMVMLDPYVKSGCGRKWEDGGLTLRLEQFQIKNI
jgi:hypothetical protein